MLSQKKYERYLKGAMKTICELMCSSGVPKDIALKRLQTAVDSGYARLSKNSIESQKISRLADVCTRWYFEHDFVDHDGYPRPLRWNGRSGSLLQLARLVVGSQQAREVVEALIEKRLVRQHADGGWLPKSRVVAPVGFESAQIQRSSQMVDRLLQTITYNSHRGYKGEVLLEVMAQVSRLPNSEIKKFKTFAKTQGLIFAKAVDDWLEARTIRRTRKPAAPTSEAGVVAFAFLESNKLKNPKRVPV